MRTKLTLAALSLSLLAALTGAAATSLEKAEEPRPLVQIAILLDTSGSMEGLIEQTKGQLWKIVNEFIRARQNGRSPEVHVALFEYGKNSLARSEGYLRMIQPLTHDLDRISEDLFALKTNGGEEYCGWVIREAVTRLAWSQSPEVYRAIFIAGNEPFTQGPVKYADSCRAAIAKGIVINTVHCGDEATGIHTKWQDGALLADGKYMIIDQNHAVVHFEAPQDKEITRLSEELNKTYVAYGAAGHESAARQVAQDVNATSFASAGAAVSRAVTKASANYRNANWDLVDAVNDGTRKLSEMKTDELPVEMQAMTDVERKTYVETKTRQRAEIQSRIKELNDERNRYVAAQVKNHAATNTLDAVMISVVRQQAASRNYRFE